MRPYRRSPNETMEGGMGGYQIPAQRDLFATVEPAAPLPPEVTRRLLPLLERLLAEALDARTQPMEGSDE